MWRMGGRMKIEEYFAICAGVFIGCILYDLINGYFRKPFYRFGKYLGKKVKQWLLAESEG